MRSSKIIKFALMVWLLSYNVSYSQEFGTLGTIIQEDCIKYLEVENEYGSFCSGYLEGIIEYKQNKESQDFNIHKCFPAYGKYDDFKRLIINTYIHKVDDEKNRGNKYVRAFDIFDSIIVQEYVKTCRNEH